MHINSIHWDRDGISLSGDFAIIWCSVYMNSRSEQAQLQGRLHFRYDIIPLADAVEYPDLLDMGD